MGAESCPLPPIFIDRWVQQCEVREIMNRLIMDLVAAHPADVLAFIHEWSAPRRVDKTTHTAVRNSLQKQQAEKPRDEQEASRSFDWPSNLDPVGNDVNNEESINNTSLIREEEPSVQELCSLYPDAKTSPFIPLVSEGSLDAQLRRRLSLSMSGSVLGGCIGRGNYGFVVPAILRPDPANAHVHKFNGDSAGSQMYTSSGGEASRMVAIKVSRVQAVWSLDEANSLCLVTECRRWLEQEVKMLQKDVEARRGGNGNGNILKSTQREKEDGLRELISPRNMDTIDDIESRLKAQSFLLKGARLVTSLVGDVMYDVGRDALWFPLEFYPSSLQKCIRARRRLCMGSFSSNCTLPDISVNKTGDTVMALLFSVREIQHVAWSLCCALNFLNGVCGLCHLDVKVDNVLLSSLWVSSEAESNSALPFSVGEMTGAPADVNNTPPLPQVVLGDLGLAQPLGTPIMQLGDFSTMAPEVYWATECEDPKYAAYRTPVFCGSSDMWSVGCILLQMINGLEYGAWGPSDMFAALEENYVSPALRHPEVWPMELNDFIDRCFERDPRRRMQASDALLHPFLAGL